MGQLELVGAPSAVTSTCLVFRVLAQLTKPKFDLEIPLLGSHSIPSNLPSVSKIPCFLENPAQSMMWKVPRLRKLCDVPCSRLFVCDFCQFGSRWRKRTHIQSWYSQDCNELNFTCSGRGGKCNATGKFHIVLKGQDRISKQLWTHLAQPYPPKFAATCAKLLKHSADQLHTFFLGKHFGI